MKDDQQRIAELEQKLELLLRKNRNFVSQIHQLREEVNHLKKSQTRTVEKADQPPIKIEDTLIDLPTKKVVNPVVKKPKVAIAIPEDIIPQGKSNIEKFIGENLISKIGIIILVFGVGIGAKYSMDNNLISPLMRIVLGYITGGALLGVGMRLREKYTNYSAVLVSGAMAVMYFITYAGYSFYGLMPQAIAFALMVVFTAFTVFAAIRYDRSVIAHIGLVGAYGVPFLLSNDSGNVVFLFSYMTLVNSGILFIAFKRYWKSIYYSSFILSWLIYLGWFIGDNGINNLGLSMLFATVFFILFYGITMAYKLVAKEAFVRQDIVLVLLNAFIFYGIGYAALNDSLSADAYLGLFTLGNAILHFVVSVVIYRQQDIDRNLFYLVIGLVLVFLTIAIPVQLDGNWVTLLWAGEALLLFWIGNKNEVAFYQKMSYPVMFIAFFSLIDDWDGTYTNMAYYYSDSYTWITPILNITFLTSILVVLCYGAIVYIDNPFAPKGQSTEKGRLITILGYLAPSLLLIVLYFAFYLEISAHCSQLYMSSMSQEQIDNYSHGDLSLLWIKDMWLINYSLLFLALLILVNNKWLKSKIIVFLTLFFAVVFTIGFLPEVYAMLKDIQQAYWVELATNDWQYVSIRYVYFALMGGVAYLLWKSIPLLSEEDIFRKIGGVYINFVALFILSTELVYLMEILGSNQSNKLGLSILWGVYALGLVVWGIWKNSQYIRIMGFALFGITLVKLFFYDIAHLETIAKTIVLVALGVLLLVISFLYNKYKTRIFEDED